MKTQYYTATSLDGFIATEDDSLEWLFALGSVAESSYPAFVAEVGALAMGAATYMRRTQPPLRLVSVQQLGTSFAELRYELT